MRVKPTRYPLLAGALCLLVVQFFFNSLFAQGTGRPKVLVLTPKTELDKKVVEAFQWDLAKALDKSGKFDIVSEKDYREYLKVMKMEREPQIPDSLIPQMMDTLKATIRTLGTLSQEGGPGTQLKAKIDFIFPKSDYAITGEEQSVADEKQTAGLAEQVARVIILASEKISRMSIARSYFNSAIYDKAIENYNKLLELEPKNVDIHYAIATSYLKMDSVQTAITKYENILKEIDPNYLPAREILAKTYFARENYEKALEHYKVLIEHKPKEYSYLEYMAYTLVKLGKNEKALEMFYNLVKLKDEDPAMRVRMGFMEYTIAGNKEEKGDSTAAKPVAKKAVLNFDRALELYKNVKNPDESTQKSLADCLYYKALSHLKAAEKQKALATFEELVQLKPDYPNLYLYLARTAGDLNKDDQSLAYYKEAIKYMPESSHWSIYQTIGSIYRKKTDYLSAAEAFTQALKTAPADKKVALYLFRGLSYHDYGNVLDYSENENVDMEALIEQEKMTKARAAQALEYYDKAVPDLDKVTGRYEKSAKQHIGRINQLIERLNKIKLQIDYYEKTK
ncbi:MAG TPA: tetratricopeptide repeat protein [archaeon]|nr:tetratricopeptide repeat protein [archaeon]